MAKMWSTHVVRGATPRAIQAACRAVFASCHAPELILHRLDGHHIFAVEHTYDTGGTRALVGHESVEEAGRAVSEHLGRVVSLTGGSYDDAFQIVAWEDGRLVDEQMTDCSAGRRLRRFRIPMQEAIRWSAFGTTGPEPHGRRVTFDEELPDLRSPAEIVESVRQASMTRVEAATQLRLLHRHREAGEFEVLAALVQIDDEQGARAFWRQNRPLTATKAGRRIELDRAHLKKLVQVLPGLVRDRAADPEVSLHQRQLAYQALGDRRGVEAMKAETHARALAAVLELRNDLPDSPAMALRAIENPMVGREPRAIDLARRALRAEVSLRLSEPLPDGLLDELARSRHPALQALGRDLEAQAAAVADDPVAHLHPSNPDRVPLLVRTLITRCLDGGALDGLLDDALETVEDSDPWRAPLVAAAVASGRAPDLVHYYSGVQSNPNPRQSVPFSPVLEVLPVFLERDPTDDDYAALALQMYDAGFSAAAALCEDARAAVASDHPSYDRLTDALKTFGLL
jgi:hypothetical protein